MKKIRCEWARNSFPAYEEYHDLEWGVPVHDDRKHFEFLVLEGAQAGLSWSTILKKREGYREAFFDYNLEKLISLSSSDIETILQNPKIVRNRLKVNSVFINAPLFQNIQQEFGSFDAYIWSFVEGKPLVNHWKSIREVPPKTEISDRLSKDLQKRGFKFVGSTIIYAHMQACGLVNDHTTDCFRYHQITTSVQKM
jgi:DNA-3-methyladenine glycosylase I